MADEKLIQNCGKSSDELWQYFVDFESKLRLKYPYMVSVPWLDSREDDVDLLVFAMVLCPTKRDANKVQHAIKYHELYQLDYDVMLLSDSLCGVKVEVCTNTHQLKAKQQQLETELKDLLRNRFGWGDLQIANYNMTVVNRIV